MNRAKSILSLLLPCAAMLILILDSKIALHGAQIGLELCIQTVVPSLFPFFVISILLTDTLSGREVAILKPISRFCKMPPGSESLLLVGLLGGYPVGAKCVHDTWKQGQISTWDAKRCLGFCSNAGPAFIFGMCGALFADYWTVWILWGIHISSALLVGHLLPQNVTEKMRAHISEGISLSCAMAQAISTMLSVCGWVILFRVIIIFFERWFLWLLPLNWQITIAGMLELANGCMGLISVESEGLRFILCSAFLGLGGLCVSLQTISVVGELGCGMYFPGKLMHCVISGCLASLFASVQYHIVSPVLPAIALIFLISLVILKKTVAFPKRLVYNVEKDWKGEFPCCSGRRSQNPAVIVPVERK